MIAYQSHDYIGILPAPNQKIILVDINYLSPESSRFAALREMKLLEDILEQMIAQGVTVLDGYTLPNVQEYIAQYKDYLQFSLSEIINYHRLSNTSFFQREEEFIRARNRRLIPELAPPAEDIDMRRENVLNYIMNSIDQVFFEYEVQEKGDLFEFTSYEEFIDFQRNYIASLTDAQLRTIELVVIGIIPISTLHYATDEEPDYNVGLKGVAFSKSGRIVVVIK